MDARTHYKVGQWGAMLGFCPPGIKALSRTLQSVSVLGEMFGDRGPPIQAAFADPDLGNGSNVESVVLGRESLGSSSRIGPEMALNLSPWLMP